MTIASELIEINGLTELQQSWYEPKEGGGFKVKQDILDGGMETELTLAPLHNAKEHERNQRQAYELKSKEQMEALESQVAASTGQLGDIGDKKARDAGDIDSLLASKEAKVRGEYDPKLEALVAELEKSKAHVKKFHVSDNASRIASELSVDGNGDALYPHIISRLSLDYDSAGEPKYIVLGKDGKPTVDTLDDLKAEIQNTESLSRLVKGSQASGGGADPSSKAGGGVLQKEKSISQLSRKERAERAKTLRAQGKR